MSRLTDAHVALAKEIIGRYPRPKSALVPLLHLAQEQDGYITRDAMVRRSTAQRLSMRCFNSSLSANMS